MEHKCLDCGKLFNCGWLLCTFSPENHNFCPEHKEKRRLANLASFGGKETK
jgi:hypothetical protein